MPARNDITKSRVLKVIKDFNPQDGYITFSDVARELFCDWATARKHVGKYEETRIACLAKGEETLDIAEKTLFKEAKTDISALKYLLSTKGKHRGYGLPSSVVNSQNVSSDFFGIETEKESGSLIIISDEDIDAMDNVLKERHKAKSYIDVEHEIENEETQNNVKIIESKSV